MSQPSTVNVRTPKRITFQLTPGMRLQHGTSIFVIESEMAVPGSFGRIFRGKRIAPDALDVVVKVPSDRTLNDPRLMKRFERERKIAANLNHPNIVRSVATWHLPDGVVALVQEFVADAMSIHEYLGKFPERAPSILLQCLYALRAMHEAPGGATIHRDLSPNNILVDKHGRVRVIDFGFAGKLPRQTILTSAREYFGTAGCIAPEASTQGSAGVDQRADLYSLGRVIAAGVLQRDPEHVDVSDLQRPWRNIYEKLSAYDRDKRYPSARDAISWSMRMLAAVGLPLHNFDLHAEEQKLIGPIRGWLQLRIAHLRGVANHVHLSRLAAIDATAFQAKGFDANRFLDGVEGSVAVQAFEQRTASYDDVDAVGTLYSKLYLYLDVQHRLRAFHRLVTVAVGWHRYVVMEQVRNVYASESSAVLRRSLDRILEQEDPAWVIEGRGILNNRP